MECGPDPELTGGFWELHIAAGMSDNALIIHLAAALWMNIHPVLCFSVDLLSWQRRPGVEGGIWTSKLETGH